MNQDKRTSRVIISVCLLGVFLLLFAGRLVQLQLVHGAEYAEQGKSISSASTRVEAARGEILDRNGNPLVTNRQGNSINSLLIIKMRLRSVISSSTASLSCWNPKGKNGLTTFR